MATYLSSVLAGPSATPTGVHHTTHNIRIHKANVCHRIAINPYIVFTSHHYPPTHPQIAPPFSPFSSSTAETPLTNTPPLRLSSIPVTLEERSGGEGPIHVARLVFSWALLLCPRKRFSRRDMGRSDSLCFVFKSSTTHCAACRGSAREM